MRNVLFFALLIALCCWRCTNTTPTNTTSVVETTQPAVVEFDIPETPPTFTSPAKPTRGVSDDLRMLWDAGVSGIIDTTDMVITLSSYEKPKAYSIDEGVYDITYVSQGAEWSVEVFPEYFYYQDSGLIITVDSTGWGVNKDKWDSRPLSWPQMKDTLFRVESGVDGLLYLVNDGDVYLSERHVKNLLLEEGYPAAYWFPKLCPYLVRARDMMALKQEGPVKPRGYLSK